jgi:PAS domain S-box-containing protein
VSGAQGTAVDITERKKAEETLRVWMNRYELIVAASGQVAYEYILCTGHITWGSSIEKVLGYTIKEISGGFIQWQKLLHPEDRETTMATLDAAQKTCTYWDTQYRLRHKIGKYLWIRDRGFFLPDSKGKAYCKLGMLEDITEHKLTDEIILQSEKRFKILYQESPIPTFTWQKKGDDFFLIDFNRAANLLTEGKARKFKGISAREMYRKRPEIINDMLRCFNKKSTIGRELVSQNFVLGKSLSVYYSYISPDLIIIHGQDNHRAQTDGRETKE